MLVDVVTPDLSFVSVTIDRSGGHLASFTHLVAVLQHLQLQCTTVYLIHRVIGPLLQLCYVVVSLSANKTN